MGVFRGVCVFNPPMIFLLLKSLSFIIIELNVMQTPKFTLPQLFSAYALQHAAFNLMTLCMRVGLCVRECFCLCVCLRVFALVCLLLNKLIKSLC